MAYGLHRFRIALTLLAFAALLLGAWPAAAQQPDFTAYFTAAAKHIDDLTVAGQWDTAIAEARRLEADIKAKFGENHPGHALALYALGRLHLSHDKYAEAEEFYERALPALEKSLGADSPNLADFLNDLGMVYNAEGKYPKAEAAFQRKLSIQEKSSADSADVATTLANIALVYIGEGKYPQAEDIYHRALPILEKTLGTDHAYVALALNNLGLVYQSEGKYAEAEGIYHRALVIREKILGPNHADVAATLVNLANVYQLEHNYAQAEGLYQRGLAILEKTLGAEHPNFALTLNNLGIAYLQEAKYAQAEGLLLRALAIRQKVLGEQHPDLGATLVNLANVYTRESKYALAETNYQRANVILTKALGADHPDVAVSLRNLAIVYDLGEKYAQAEPLYQRAIAIEQAKLGANHPNTATSLYDFAEHYSRAGNAAQALAFSRKASVAVIAHAATENPGAERQPGAGGLVVQRVEYFRDHVAHIAAAARLKIEPTPTLAREAFEIAQWASQSSVAAALQRTTARFAGTDALGTLVRESQDLAAAWRNDDKALIDAESRPQGQQDQAAIALLHKRLAETESKLAANSARIEKEFPDYAALISPKPLTVAETQKLLGPDEALVFFLTHEKESYVFALTHDGGLGWGIIPFGADALPQKIATFRRGLNPGELRQQKEAMKKGGRAPDSFDVRFAYQLYDELLGPVDEVIKTRKQLLVVASGPLTSLPFHLLVTAKPVVLPSVNNPTPYRDVAWLIKRQAITILPSVTSLKALRGLAHKGAARKTLTGFGDPIFDPNAPAVKSSRGARKLAQRNLVTRSYTDFWNGAGVDRERLSKSLPPLPDTAVELKAVAQKLGVPATDIHLRGEASETTVKRAPLADYRIVYFATHGLVAGDVRGLAEPALALTIPTRPNDFDDGLLTASEVAQLKLNADWVVLSACNTIAGDKPGAEALSGLARAFFYAGARALLVSHWAVDSEAATRLTTTTFNILKADGSIGRAEALRRAMLAVLNEPADPNRSYPTYWAPFEIVGEGAGQ